MNTFLRLLLLYIPAVYGYLALVVFILDYNGYLEDEFDTNDYKPVYSQTQSTKDRQTTVTYYELK